MQTEKICIIIPTYNERENIGPLVQAIVTLAIPDCSIVIVDDNSPDGTGERADALAGAHPAVSVIHREKKDGLGPAYIAGFDHALRSDAGLIFEIDADGSHDPALIPRFIEAARSADLVLGSRYIPGGAIKNWSALRRFVSHFGNVYARLVLSVSTRDLTGGYKCYRRAVLEAIDIHTLSSLGYVFQIETTYKALRAGFRVQEIPITFTERKTGLSKFNAAIFFGAFIKVLGLRFRR